MAKVAARPLIPKFAPAETYGYEAYRKTIGLIGIGNIGRIVARIMKYGYNMRVLGYSRHLTKERAELHVMFLKTGNEAEDFVWKISFDFLIGKKCDYRERIK